MLPVTNGKNVTGNENRAQFMKTRVNIGGVAGKPEFLVYDYSRPGEVIRIPLDQSMIIQLVRQLAAELGTDTIVVEDTER